MIDPSHAGESMDRCAILLRAGSPDGEASIALAGELLPGVPVDIQVVAEPASGSGPKRWKRLVSNLDRAASEGHELLGGSAGTVEAVLQARIPDRCDLLILDPSLPKALTEDALRAGVSVGWPGPHPRATLRSVALPYSGAPHALLAPLTWLKEHHPPERARALALDGHPLEVVELADQLLGLSFAVDSEALPAEHRSLAALRDHLRSTDTDLVAVAAPNGPELWPALLLLGEAGVPCPVLIVPGEGSLIDLRPRLQCTDFVPLGGELRAGVVRVDAIGRARGANEELTVVVEGIAHDRATAEHGEVRLPRVTAGIIGLGEPDGTAAHQILTGGAVLSLDGAPIRLLLVGDPVPWEPSLRRWIVRFAGDPGPSELRGRGIDAVISGSAVLDDGAPADLPDTSGPARLERVKRHLTWIGAPVVDAPIPPVDRSLGEQLRVLAGAQASTATLTALHLDNEEARLALLASIETATRSVWMQSFMFEDDAVGDAVASALGRAADRGVDVRLLVDSVFSGHGALGLSNPALAPLDAHPTAQVRSAKPVSEFLDLRKREHRKLLIIDGLEAGISGRNIGAPYYTGFSECALEPTSGIRDVPWLDAGVRLTGAAVRPVAAAFSQGWQAAGGEPLELPESSGGVARCHLVLHETMADAFTLEAYRVLLESAQERVTLVNTFPIQFELQRVLLALLARGVQLRFLVGNVRPLHGAGVPFPGEPFRALANRVVHGRLDPLARAGADVRALVLPWREPWDSQLHRILPHVHAKLLTVDGKVATLGSANLDIAASYWDNEALLIVDDESFTARLDRKLDTLFEGSAPFDPSDKGWQEQAEARREISRIWPSWAT